MQKYSRLLIVVIACIFLSSYFLSSSALAEDGADQGHSANAFCQHEAQRLGVNDGQATTKFIALCLRSIDICESEAMDANLENETEFNDYVSQCLEEIMASGDDEEEFENDDEQSN